MDMTLEDTSLRSHQRNITFFFVWGKDSDELEVKKKNHLKVPSRNLKEVGFKLC